MGGNECLDETRFWKFCEVGFCLMLMRLGGELVLRRLMKKVFDWTLFEMCLLGVAVLVVAVLGFLFGSDLLTFFCAMVGVTGSMLIAKGKLFGQILRFVLVVLYSIQSYREKYYGEIITFVCFMLPLYIFGIISWFRNRDHEKVIKVNTFKSSEWIAILIVSAIVYVGMVFVLKAIHTSQVFVSALSVVNSAVVVYLISRRNRFGFLACSAHDLVLVFLWSLPVFSGSFYLLPMIISPIVDITIDAYGWKSWGKLKQKQMNQSQK